MASQGDLEICRYSGTRWEPLPGGLSEIRSLLSSALDRLEASTKDNTKKRVQTAIETASVIATMPESSDADMRRWENDGGLTS